MFCWHKFDKWVCGAVIETVTENYVGTHNINQCEQPQTRICKKCGKMQTKTVVIHAWTTPTGYVRIQRVEDY